MRSHAEDALGIQSVQVGHALLRALARAGKPLSLGELAELTTMSTSKARGYLISYLQLGLVRQLSQGGLYDLGPEALSLGLAALGRVDAVNLAREALPVLHQQVQETVCLSVWSDHGPVVFDKLDGPRQSVFALRIGTVAGLLTTATGRVFLSYLPSASVAHVLRREVEEDLLDIARSIQVDALRSQTQEAGFSTVSDVTLPGLSSMAAPIFDCRGILALVVNVVGPTRSMDMTADGPMAIRLKEFAGLISERAGAR